jgi:hypothetical protein
MGKFAQSFAALTECLFMLKQVVYNYDNYKQLELIDPPSVKKAVGAKGSGSNKDLIKNSLMEIARLENWHLPLIESLDEHSVDATAVAYSKIIQFK